MRTTIIRLMSILGSVLLLLAVLIALLRFYPYNPHFPTYPRITHTQSGAEGDPLNLVFVGSQEQITRSFHQAGWLIPDPITPQTSEKIAVASLAHRSYPTAPVSNLYVFGRVQDLAFEKPTHDVANRGHIRLWKTGTLIGGQLVWIGQASYDRGIELSGTTHLPTHHIAPTVDLERNAVGADLAKTGLVKEEADAAFTPPIVYARNGGGDYYESDGDVLVINYTQAPIPLTPPAWVIDGLKNGVFLVYDALFTLFGALIAFLVLVAVLITGLMLWRLTERNRALERK
jgi:LssY-like putative type I secretion system component LssY